MPDILATVRRRAYAAALTVFRWLPAPVRRGVVRVGTPGFTVGAVCAIDHDGALLVLRQPHRHGWTLPGGLLERGESAADAVVRELHEETQLSIEVGVPLTVKVNARVRRVDVVFRIAVDSRPDARPGGEATEVRWLLPDEVLPTADEPTREILALLARATQPGAAEGRVVAGP
jgi:ADP-ribose pyrophosphatase YjhB (NUDIX family)